jgi:hypothetical protein
MKHVSSVAEYVLELLDGGSGPDPSKHGMTSEEERLASRFHQVCRGHVSQLRLAISDTMVSWFAVAGCGIAGAASQLRHQAVRGLCHRAVPGRTPRSGSSTGLSSRYCA